jgi:hypothetical protein
MIAPTTDRLCEEINEEEGGRRDRLVPRDVEFRRERP